MKVKMKQGRREALGTPAVVVRLSVLGLASLLPEGLDLSFYLGDLLHVATSFVVGKLGGELVDLLLIHPVKFQVTLQERNGREG